MTPPTIEERETLLPKVPVTRSLHYSGNFPSYQPGRPESSREIHPGADASFNLSLFASLLFDSTPGKPKFDKTMIQYSQCLPSYPLLHLAEFYTNSIW